MKKIIIAFWHSFECQLFLESVIKLSVKIVKNLNTKNPDLTTNNKQVFVSDNLQHPRKRLPV